MNVKVLHERQQVIRMPPVRSSRPTDTDKVPLRNSPPKVAQSPKVASQPKGALTKCSPSSQQQQKPSQQQQKPQHKPPSNSNVCFLCGKAGHFGSQTSCLAANKKRNPYY